MKRVAKAAPLMFPTMAMLDGSKAAISKLESVFADEFHDYWSGAASFDIKGFTKALEREVGRREDLREDTRKASRPEPVLGDADTERSSCIMS